MPWGTGTHPEFLIAVLHAVIPANAGTLSAFAILRLPRSSAGVLELAHLPVGSGSAFPFLLRPLRERAFTTSPHITLRNRQFPRIPFRLLSAFFRGKVE